MLGIHWQKREMIGPWIIHGSLARQVRIRAFWAGSARCWSGQDLLTPFRVIEAWYVHSTAATRLPDSQALIPSPNLSVSINIILALSAYIVTLNLKPACWFAHCIRFFSPFPSNSESPPNAHSNCSPVHPRRIQKRLK